MRNTNTKPALRFSEFKEEWKEKRLSEFLTRYSENNKDGEFSIDEILSLSSHYGIVSRKELLEETYSDVNYLNYKKTRLNDFVYGKSISKNYPFGLFKVNDFKDGLLSTLYFTFKVKENTSPIFLDSYFSHFIRANNFLRKFVLVGDRYITADADYLLSGKIYVPTQIQEQTKIASFLKTIDQRITQLTEKKQQLEIYKKGITQQLFSQQIRFKDENGKEFPKWEMKKLEEVFTRKSTKNKNSLIKNVLTNSATKGIVSQNDYFDKDIANQNNLEGYYIVEIDDFVYNPRISQSAPVGPLKRNNLEKGVMSPLYTVLKCKQGDLGFYENYFDTNFWHKYMRGIANYGVRHDRMNITNEGLEKLPLPFPSIKEQEKIANFLNAISEQIQKVSEQLEETKTFKKGLLNQLFVN
jgi:type I restriction enzyme S subunit